MLDAYGRRRSARSIPTGPGSRGGKELGPEYWRAWRAAHPEYQERERTRRKRQKAEVRQAREERHGPIPSFTDALRAMVGEEVEQSSLRSVARRLGLLHTTLMRILNGDVLEPRSDFVDAVVSTYGIDICVRDFRRRTRKARSAT